MSPFRRNSLILLRTIRLARCPYHALQARAYICAACAFVISMTHTYPTKVLCDPPSSTVLLLKSSRRCRYNRHNYMMKIMHMHIF
jgi:hypothetical protein